MLAGLVLTGGTLLAACGGGSSAPATTTTTKPTLTSAEKAAVKKAFATLFNFANPSVGAKVAVVEDGTKLRAALTQGLSSPLASQAAGAKVTGTKVLSASACKAAAVSAPCARVDYDILSPQGTPLMSGSSGYAVKANGTWLVAKPTVCGLLAQMYSTMGKTGTPEGC